MKKIIWIIFFTLIISGIMWGISSNNNKEESRQKEISKNENTEQSNTENTDKTNNTDGANNVEHAKNTENTNTSENTQTMSQENIIPEIGKTNQTGQEIVISEFATSIHNKSKERQNNITITCRTINGKEIKPGEIFSFCNTVGEATTEKGYQESEIYVDGEKKQGLGGGNCQVSTTIYNAVLQIPELEIVERHEHSNHVTYIAKGKDAAVAYGSYDFKFKNNTSNKIKIIMENTENEVRAKIIKVI